MMSVGILCIRMALLYAVVAMAIGLYMAISRDHTLVIAHAHLAIIGWFGLLSTGVLFRNLPQLADGRSSWVIALLLTVGLPIMVVGIAFLSYGMVGMAFLAKMGSLVVFAAVAILAFRIWTVDLS